MWIISGIMVILWKKTPLLQMGRIRYNCTSKMCSPKLYSHTTQENTITESNLNHNHDEDATFQDKL